MLIFVRDLDYYCKTQLLKQIHIIEQLCQQNEIEIN